MKDGGLFRLEDLSGNGSFEIDEPMVQRKTTMKLRFYILFVILFVGSGFLAFAQAPNPIPIPQNPTNHPLPTYIGAPATPNPVSTSAIPQNPFLAAAGGSNCHNDTYMSDVYFTGGPLGTSPLVLSSLLATPTDPFAEIACMAFDQKGRIITLTAFTPFPRLLLIDPVTLATLASFPLSDSGFGGGGYFYLDQNDHLVLPSLNQILVLAVTDNPPQAPAFKHLNTYDLSAAVPGDVINFVLPDFTGRLWFATKGSLVGALQPDTGVTTTLALQGEQITNSIATDATGGLFLASDHAMYRFDVDALGKPGLTWREPYDRGNRIKAGQLSQGTGTTPTLMGTDYVTITDNADPQMHVNVYRRAKTVAGNRLLCSVPVFQPGQGADESSLIATDRSIIAANTAGFRIAGPPGVLAFKNGRQLGTFFPGLTRIDVDDSGCHTVWTNDSIRTSAVPKLSVQNGLIYAYNYDTAPDGDDGFYFTAVDFHTGQTVFQRLIGQGFSFDTLASIHLGPDGKTAYVGVLIGLVAIRDTQ